MRKEITERLELIVITNLHHERYNYLRGRSKFEIAWRQNGFIYVRFCDISKKELLIWGLFLLEVEMVTPEFTLTPEYSMLIIRISYFHYFKLWNVSI